MPGNRATRNHVYEAPLKVTQRLPVETIQKVRSEIIFFVMDDKSPEMEMAIDAAEKSDVILPQLIKKIDEDFVKKMLSRNPQKVIGIFVVSDFDSEIFRLLTEHSSKVKACRVVGPIAITQTCSPRPAQKFPFAEFPIYSLAMKGLVVTISSHFQEKAPKFRNRIIALSGWHLKKMESSVNVLIAKDVVCPEAKAAREMGIDIVSVEWLDNCWEKRSVVLDARKCIREYKLPIFTGVVVTATNFDWKDKDDIKKVVERNGGIYQDKLIKAGHKQHTPTTHLICPTNIMESREKSGKFDAAKEWGLFITGKEWIYQCVREGYALPEKEFLLVTNDTENSQSIDMDLTPTLEPPDLQNIVEQQRRVDVEPPRLMTPMNTSVTTSGQPSFKNICASTPAVVLISIDDQLRTLENQRSSSLDSLNIFLYGFKPDRYNLFKRLVERNEGYVLQKFEPEAHFCVVDRDVDIERVKEFNQHIEDSGSTCKLVREDWLLESIRSRSIHVEWAEFSLISSQENSTQDTQESQIISQQSFGFKIRKQLPQEMRTKSMALAARQEDLPHIQDPVDDDYLLSQYNEDSPSTQRIPREFSHFERKSQDSEVSDKSPLNLKSPLRSEALESLVFDRNNGGQTNDYDDNDEVDSQAPCVSPILPDTSMRDLVAQVTEQHDQDFYDALGGIKIKEEPEDDGYPEPAKKKKPTPKPTSEQVNRPFGQNNVRSIFPKTYSKSKRY